MIILRQKVFANKANKEMVRDWKLRQRIKHSGIVDEINASREEQIRELTKGQKSKKGFLGIGRQDVPHATKLTEEEIFNQAKGGRRAYQEKMKYDLGKSNFWSLNGGENPELFKKVNKDSAARGTRQVAEHKNNLNSMITNQNSQGIWSYGDSKVGNRKSSAARRRELGLDLTHGEQYHMSGAEYHAKRAAKKKAAEEAKATLKPTPTPTPKPTSTPKVAAKEGNKVLRWVKKNPGKTALGVGVTAGIAYGGKKAYDKYKKKKEENK